MEGHLMKVDKGSKRIMNLDSILDFGEVGALNLEIGESEEQAKFDFSVVTVTACRAKFKKIISSSILIGIVSFLYSN